MAVDACSRQMDLIVSSRDVDGVSRLVTVELVQQRGEWRLERAGVLLEAHQIGDRCVGVMGGCMWVHPDGCRYVLGNAYFRNGSTFSSEIFICLLDRPHDVAWTFPAAHGQALFRAVPGVVTGGLRPLLVFSASPGLLPRLHGFPPSYGLYAAPLDGTVCSGRAEPWWWPTPGAAALAKVSQERTGTVAWTSLRDARRPDAGYGLVRLDLTEDRRGVHGHRAIDGKLAYPEVVDGVGVLASAGRAGELGLVLIGDGTLEA